MTVEVLEPFPPMENPFEHDVYNMGTYIGTNVCVMFDAGSMDVAKYIIVVDTRTGERIKISFNHE